jgi:hypothetical protein
MIALDVLEKEVPEIKHKRKYKKRTFLYYLYTVFALLII